MKLTNLLESPTPIILNEFRRRIEHPEDMIFDNGLSGAISALDILQSTADHPKNVSLKIDGSPSLIAGWMGDKFVLTDKAGFVSKKYNGLTTSPEAIESMLMNRKVPMASPEQIKKRREYAKFISGLYPVLKSAIPNTVQGFVQGDLLWIGIPRIKNGYYQFQPNKIKYSVPVNSIFGHKISGSRCGMAIHSFWKSRDQKQPTPIQDASKLGINEKSGLTIFPHEIHFQTKLTLISHIKNELNQIINKHSNEINSFFDKAELSLNGIKSLPSYMKSFLAFKASKGDPNMNNLAKEFQDWIDTGANGKISGKMMVKIKVWINEHSLAYNLIWKIVKMLVELKLNLKTQMEKQVSGIIKATLNNKKEQEGFVSDTPKGTIKLVNRSDFMNDLTPTNLMESDKKEIIWAFIRGNPPTIAHKMLISKMKKLANGKNWIVFLSHSQDSKKNPLDWSTKMDFFKKIMPEFSDHFYDGDQDIYTPLQAADYLYKEGYRKMIYVCGEDRVDSSKEMLDNWNSPDVLEKYNRDHVDIDIKSAGKRDPDSKGMAGVSGTKARKAVEDNDMNEFKKNVGIDGNIATELFNAVKNETGIHALSKAVKKLKENTEARPWDHPHGTIVKLVMNAECADKLINWCKSQNIPCIDKQDLHITILYSKTPVPHLESMHGNNVRVIGKPTDWKVMGDSALTLLLDCPISSQFHNSLKKQGGSHKFNNYIPHATVWYKWDKEFTPNNIPDFLLVFDKIVVSPVDPDWKPR